ncbi:hypothetical protein HK102_001768, partial [Quaeritorhiza haematococci]
MTTAYKQPSPDTAFSDIFATNHGGQSSREAGGGSAHSRQHKKKVKLPDEGSGHRQAPESSSSSGQNRKSAQKVTQADVQRWAKESGRVKERQYDINIVTTQMPPYEPLKDEYLQDYFNSPVVRKHLLKVGLIDHHGRIIDRKAFKYNQIRLDKKEYTSRILKRHFEQDLDREIEVAIRTAYGEKSIKSQKLRRLHEDAHRSSSKSFPPTMRDTAMLYTQHRMPFLNAEQLHHLRLVSPRVLKSMGITGYYHDKLKKMLAKEDRQKKAAAAANNEAACDGQEGSGPSDGANQPEHSNVDPFETTIPVDIRLVNSDPVENEVEGGTVAAGSRPSSAVRGSTMALFEEAKHEYESGDTTATVQTLQQLLRKFAGRPQSAKGAGADQQTHVYFNDEELNDAHGEIDEILRSVTPGVRWTESEKRLVGCIRKLGGDISQVLPKVVSAKKGTAKGTMDDDDDFPADTAEMDDYEQGELGKMEEDDASGRHWVRPKSARPTRTSKFPTASEFSSDFGSDYEDDLIDQDDDEDDDVDEDDSFGNTGRDNSDTESFSISGGSDRDQGSTVPTEADDVSDGIIRADTFTMAMSTPLPPSDIGTPIAGNSKQGSTADILQEQQLERVRTASQTLQASPSFTAAMSTPLPPSQPGSIPTSMRSSVASVYDARQGVQPPAQGFGSNTDLMIASRTPLPASETGSRTASARASVSGATGSAPNLFERKAGGNAYTSKDLLATARNTPLPPSEPGSCTGSARGSVAQQQREVCEPQPHEQTSSNRGSVAALYDRAVHTLLPPSEAGSRTASARQSVSGSAFEIARNSPLPISDPASPTASARQSFVQNSRAGSQRQSGAEQTESPNVKPTLIHSSQSFFQATTTPLPPSDPNSRTSSHRNSITAQPTTVKRSDSLMQAISTALPASDPASRTASTRNSVINLPRSSDTKAKTQSQANVGSATQSRHHSRGGSATKVNRAPADIKERMASRESMSRNASTSRPGSGSRTSAYQLRQSSVVAQRRGDENQNAYNNQDGGVQTLTHTPSVMAAMYTSLPASAPLSRTGSARQSMNDVRKAGSVSQSQAEVSAVSNASGPNASDVIQAPARTESFIQAISTPLPASGPTSRIGSARSNAERRSITAITEQVSNERTPERTESFIQAMSTPLPASGPTSRIGSARSNAESRSTTAITGEVSNERIPERTDSFIQAISTPLPASGPTSRIGSARTNTERRSTTGMDQQVRERTPERTDSFIQAMSTPLPASGTTSRTGSARSNAERHSNIFTNEQTSTHRSASVSGSHRNQSVFTAMNTPLPPSNRSSARSSAAASVRNSVTAYDQQQENEQEEQYGNEIQEKPAVLHSDGSYMVMAVSTPLPNSAPASKPASARSSVGGGENNVGAAFSTHDAAGTPKWQGSSASIPQPHQDVQPNSQTGSRPASASAPQTQSRHSLTQLQQPGSAPPSSSNPQSAHQSKPSSRPTSAKQTASQHQSRAGSVVLAATTLTTTQKDSNSEQPLQLQSEVDDLQVAASIPLPPSEPGSKAGSARPSTTNGPNQQLKNSEDATALPSSSSRPQSGSSRGRSSAVGTRSAQRSKKASRSGSQVSLSRQVLVKSLSMKSMDMIMAQQQQQQQGPRDSQPKRQESKSSLAPAPADQPPISEPHQSSRPASASSSSARAASSTDSTHPQTSSTPAPQQQATPFPQATSSAR